MILPKSNPDFIYEIVQGDASRDFPMLCFDTRKATADSLFVAIKGANFDAHDAIDELVEKGVKAFVVEKEASVSSDCLVIKVDDTRHALAYLSNIFFGCPTEKLAIIGVTGTKGKTTTTHMIKHLFELSGRKTALIGTNGIHYADVHKKTINTTPDSYELAETFADMVSKGIDTVVMEVSSQATKMHRVDAIYFEACIFLNITPDHIGPNEHADFDEYLECKSDLFKSCKNAFINIDDPHADYIIKNSTAKNIYTFGTSQAARYRADDFRILNTSELVGFTFDFIHDDAKVPCTVGIPGSFNMQNALASISLCHEYGIDDNILSEGLRNIHVNGRMEIAYSSDKITVLIDYAHNAISMESLLHSLKDYHPKRLVVVFGCGGNKDKKRRYTMGESAGRMADLSIITADNSRNEKTQDIIDDIVGSLLPTGGKYIEIPDRREAIFYAIEHAMDGDVIAIIGKGHEDYQEENGHRVHFLDREVVDEAIDKFIC